MNILLQQGGHAFANVGDMAMLQVTVDRFRREWPESNISVMVAPGFDAGRHLEGVNSIDRKHVSRAFAPGCLLGRFSNALNGIDSYCVTRYPSLLQLVALKRWVRDGLAGEAFEVARLLGKADIVAAAGGGYLTDAFPQMVEWTAWLLLSAQRLGKRTALFGQGIGPLRDPRLRQLLRRALRKADVIGLREGLYGPALAAELGVCADRCIVTGDDALEPAYRAARPTIAGKLGLNLRRAWFADVSDEIESRLSKVVLRLAAELKTEPLIIPIASNHGDAEVGARIVGCQQPDGGLLQVSDAIRLASECRVVVTGSYHAGVFALGQGIPVVGIVSSTYYRQKFAGLAAQFPEGCLVVEGNSPTFEADLANGTLNLWNRVEVVRPSLLATAKSQIERSETIYRQFVGHVNAGSRRWISMTPWDKRLSSQRPSWT